jgi:glycerol-3-phosphate O-acyltransferase / dihydroxyacetone phosphate acyltransferase
MAEASWKRRIVGDIAWALGVVPVKRAQDDAVKGLGKVSLAQPVTVPKTESEEEQITIAVKGSDTKFTAELAVGDKIRPPGTAHGLKVKKIDSDTSMVVSGADLPPEFPTTLFGNTTAVSYDIMKRIPLTTVFEKVLDRLSGGGALGIFPEGGSHDRTDLLPLKVGISLIAYSALEKDGLSIPVVPVGLSYFRAHRWRGRAVVEYGRPFYVDPSTLEDFKAGGSRRRNVCNAFLEEVETSMRSVIISAPDYDTLELIHTARRLYQRKKGPMVTVEKQNMIRRFVEGYKRLLLMTDGNPPREWLDLQARIAAYRDELKDLGMKDYQEPALKEERLDETIDIEKVDGDNVLRFLQLPYYIVHKLFLIVVSAIPIILLNLPVAVLAGLYSESRRKKALANSKVKIKGYDVSCTVALSVVFAATRFVHALTAVHSVPGHAHRESTLLPCHGSNIMGDVWSRHVLLYTVGTDNDCFGHAFHAHLFLHWNFGGRRRYSGVERLATNADAFVSFRTETPGSSTFYS